MNVLFGILLRLRADYFFHVGLNMEEKWEPLIDSRDRISEKDLGP